MLCQRVNHFWSLRIKHVVAAACLLASVNASPASAQTVRITKLADVDFATVANLGADQTRTQSVCAFSSTTGGRYRVTASGSGSGGAFTLASGARTLAYEVQWNSAPGQATGISLSSNVARGGFTSAARNQQCTSGDATTASLIVVLRAAQLSAASAGAYTGTLSIILAPE
jgi:hypothetical protein